MKKWLKRIGKVLLALVAAIGAYLGYVAIVGIPHYAPIKVDLKVESTPERVARGRRFATILCAECHKDPTTGKLTGKHLADGPDAFGVIVSANITRDPNFGIGTWTDGELAALFRTGITRDGRYLPPYMVKLAHLSDEDLTSIIAFLRSDDPLVAAAAQAPPRKNQPSFLIKLLSHLVWKPLPYPKTKIEAPPAGDKVALGRYLFFGLECYGCHGNDFKTIDIEHPEKTGGYLGGGNQLLDFDKQPIYTSNISMDEETGIGKWSEADFKRALREGFRPDSSLIRYPMQPVPELSDEESSAIYAYLRTQPAVKHLVPRAARAAVADADPGKQAYFKYGCVACHGMAGVGVADLRRARVDFPTDDALLEFLKDAPKFRPGTKMPRWQGIVADADFPLLVGYVRALAH
jgi:mono/diheme cytochrome c family protein